MNGGKRRDSTEISYDILKAAQGGQRKTRIMYQSRLNLHQLNERMDELISCELLSYQPSGRYFSTTEKGREFSRMFESFRETTYLLTEQKKRLSGFLIPRATKPVAVPAS
jgi:predicted transcriptional regulator